MSPTGRPSDRHAAPHGSRQGPEERRMQGHWLLAKLGKRVLRPGGIDLTIQLLANAAPTAADRIVEFGPGVGRTASILLDANPRSYVGVDPSPEGRGPLDQVLAAFPQAQVVVADAADTGLPGGEADLVVGEAMLSMQSRQEKQRIVTEAARLLAPGGRYAIHELLRTGDVTGLAGDADDERGSRDPVAKDVSRTIKVGARPLPLDGWQQLLTDAGLEVTWTSQAPMRLLEPSRIIADEGPLGALRFATNLLRNKPARERVLAMRRTFRANAGSLAAIAMVARKPSDAGGPA